MRHMSSTRKLVAGLSASVLMLAGAATAHAAPVNVPWSPDTSVDSELEFVSDGVTYYGSLRPAIGEVRGAALLLPGSGPIDRNGNSPEGNITPNTIAYLADALAAKGITTLRFDKIGTGRTGTEGIDTSVPLGFTQQIDTAEAAAAALSDATGISGEKFSVLGHSEGGLTALALADRGVEIGNLGLLAPLAIRYLDLLHAQLDRVLDNVVASGEMTPEEADAERGRVDETIDAIRNGRPVPYPDDEILASVGLSDSGAKFFSEADALDPAVLAAALPADTDVLLTCSEKDLNVSCGQTNRVADALAGRDLQYSRFVNSSHMLSELGPLPATGLDIYAPLPQSSEFRGALDAWADSALS